ncbi:hypothetical protein J7K44_00820 [bacterium]|nr:hypothetical protein [bacterium]
MKIDSLIKFAIIYAIVRPVFYIYYEYFGRISDLTALVLGIFVLLFILKKIPKISNIYIFWFIAFEISIALTFLVNSFPFELSFRDFVIMGMPVYLLVAVLLGISLVRGRIDRFNGLINIVITLSILNSVIALVQYLSRDTAFSNLFYYLYSVPNLLEQGRPSGFTYIHYGYTAFSFLAPLFLISKTFVSKKKNYILPIIIFTALSFLSLSRGGIIFIAVTLFSFFIFYGLLSFQKLYGFVISLKSFIKIGVPLFILTLVLIYFFSYLYYGFQALFHLDLAHKSIGHRVNDMLTVKEWIFKDGLHFLIGYSPLRKYSEVSYIEISFFNILFRFGIIGLFFYYSFFLFPFFKFIKIKNFTFNKDRQFFVYCVAVTSIIFGIILSDFTVNMSEAPKFSFIVAVILGAMVSVLDQLKSERKEFKESYE